METPPCSAAEAERLRDEIDRLKKTIRMLEAEIQRLRQKLIGTWGSDE